MGAAWARCKRSRWWVRALAGSTAAIALRQRGFEVTVYEQARRAGRDRRRHPAQPQCHARAHRAWPRPAFEAIAFEPDRHVVRNWKSGSIVSATQMRGVFRPQYGAGYFGAHRADLHAVLQNALPARLHPAQRALHRRRQTPGDRVRLRFADGSTAEADVVVGADGLRSAVRMALYGPDTPHFTGHICWRGLVPAAALPKGLIEPDMTAWFGPNGTVVHYYVRRGELVNWIAHFESDWRDESWRGRERLARGRRRLCRLASDAGRALFAHRALLQMGALRPRAAAALDERPRDAARRRRASDAALSRAGRGAGDRGRLRAR